MKKKVFVTSSFEETQKLGEEFARDIVKRHPSGVVLIALYGELGSGKTTFVQGMAKGLGIKRRIISPTFIIVRNYKIRIKDKGLMIKNFYHIDLYRIDNEKSIKGLGIEEIIEDPQNVIVIEWAERMGSLLPKKRWDLRFEYVGEEKRKILIVSP